MSEAVRPRHEFAPISRLFPVLRLLNPRGYGWALIISLELGLLVGFGLMYYYSAPVWLVTLVVLICLVPIGVKKFRDDYRAHGGVVMLLSIILVTQGVHTIEHFVQWAQYYVLLLPAREANGLLSPANAEWVHFYWNVGVLLSVIGLLIGGVQNVWTYLLLGVAVGHTIEHGYLFYRYLEVLKELEALGISDITAQGLAGICGRDGWLARSPLTQGTFLSRIPGLTTAMRLDVHFWWNFIEVGFLIIAANVFLRSRWSSRRQADQ